MDVNGEDEEEFMEEDHEETESTTFKIKVRFIILQYFTLVEFEVFLQAFQSNKDKLSIGAKY